MKKFIILLLILTVFAAGASALDIGGGLVLQFDSYTGYNNVYYDRSFYGFFGFLGNDWFDFEFSYYYAAIINDIDYDVTDPWELAVFLKIPIKTSNIVLSPAIGISANTEDLKWFFDYVEVKLRDVLEFQVGLVLDIFLEKSFFVRYSGFFTIDIFDSFVPDYSCLNLRLAVGFRY